MPSDRRLGTSESRDYYAGGLLPGGDYCPAGRYMGQEGGYVGRFDNFQIFVGGVVPETPHFACRVVKGKSLVPAKGLDMCLVETLPAGYDEMVLVPMENESHHPPEIVQPVRVVEWHGPSFGLGWETAQEKDPGTFRKKRLERMTFNTHNL